MKNYFKKHFKGLFHDELWTNEKKVNQMENLNFFLYENY